MKEPLLNKVAGNARQGHRMIRTNDSNEPHKRMKLYALSRFSGESAPDTFMPVAASSTRAMFCIVTKPAAQNLSGAC